MMKTAKNYLINNRTLTAFAEIDKELKCHSEKNYVFDLSYMGVMNVEGTNAIDFLQGQLTCDLRLVSDIQMIQGAQCNLKGRILAFMDIITWQGTKLVLPQDLIEPTINSLNKTAMLSRVALQKNTQLSVFGFYLQNSQDIVPDSNFFPHDVYAQTHSAHACYYHLGNGFYIFLAQTEFANDVFKRFSEKNQLLGSLTWHTLSLTRQQFDIYPESRGLFLPHRLDLHQTQFLSFNKGCYKGQEIIARMHYKSTLKHQLRIFCIKTNQKIYSGQKLLKSPQGTEIGELVDFSLLDQDYYLVAVSILKETDNLVLFEGHNEPIELSAYAHVSS